MYTVSTCTMDTRIRITVCKENTYEINEANLVVPDGVWVANKVKPAHAVTSIKQSPVLKGQIFLDLL